MEKVHIFIGLTVWNIIMIALLSIIPIDFTGGGVSTESHSTFDSSGNYNKTCTSSYPNVFAQIADFIDPFVDYSCSNNQEAKYTDSTLIRNISYLGPFNAILLFMVALWIFLLIGLIKDLVNPLVQS